MSTDYKSLVLWDLVKNKRGSPFFLHYWNPTRCHFWQCIEQLFDSLTCAAVKLIAAATNTSNFTQKALDLNLLCWIMKTNNAANLFNSSWDKCKIRPVIANESSYLIGLLLEFLNFYRWAYTQTVNNVKCSWPGQCQWILHKKFWNWHVL